MNHAMVVLGSFFISCCSFNDGGHEVTPSRTAVPDNANILVTKTPSVVVARKKEFLDFDRSDAPIQMLGEGPGWQALGIDDFVNVNCQDDTWDWREGVLYCKGNCVGVYRSKNEYVNFELVVDWRHMKTAGNSGVFVWSPRESLDALKPKTNGLPHGIEVQVLDHGYKTQYEKQTGKKAEWFTTNGDVFPVGAAKMKPFEPLSPNGIRSFPSADHTKGVGQWNQYYIRAINGEVRLWVNGVEVSGGNGCDPKTGFIALESEGSPIEFKNIYIRVLP